MIEPVLNLFRGLKDPLRSSAQAGRWIAVLSRDDTFAVQKEALEVVAGFPGPRKEIGAAQAEALLRIDAFLEPVLAEFTRQYTQNYQKSSSIETRLWHAVFDLVKAFLVAYNASLKAGYARAENKRWRAVLPWVLVRLAHYKGVDGKFRLFRYGQWIPAQWRELHELYEFARMRGWQREQLVFGAAAFSVPGITFEQEYLKALLLMRLDSGNFTPDQVEWVARHMDDWAPSLSLVPPPGEGAGFYVDLTGTQGLRRREKRALAGRVQMLDTAPAYARIVEQLRWLPEQDDAVPKPGDLPAREQRLLLMRLASLFGPEAIAHAPRAERFSVDGEVRVVVGLPALTRAVAEIDRLPEAARTPGVTASFDEVTELQHPAAGSESVARRIQGSTWRIADRSDTGCRLIAPAREAPSHLGELVAIRDGDAWTLGVVRRMQRSQADEVTVGVEVVARKLVRVLMRTWSAPSDDGRSAAERPFFGLYIPAHADNRQSAQRSLVGPDDRLVQGAMVELDTGNARYLVRFTQMLERQAGWSWALFSAVRKLSS
jgi:hypothetical protein